jgi:hypothetical protein
MDAEAYLTGRVDDQIAFYERAAGRAKRTHLSLQTAIILLGVLVPTAVNLPTRWHGTDFAPTLQLVVTVLSVALAGLTGLANFRKHGELWLTYRTAGELLKNEKHLFLTGSGPYRPPEAGLADFVERVEAILAAERTDFRTLVVEARQAGTPPGPGPASAPAAEAGA